MPTKSKRPDAKAPTTSAKTPDVPPPAAPKRPAKKSRPKVTPQIEGGVAHAPGDDCGTYTLESSAPPPSEAASTATIHLEMLRLDAIRIDPELQVRAEGLDEDVVKEYREQLQFGTRFPPVEVCRDADGIVWLFSGFHRTEATKRAGFDEIAANVRSGGKREALLAALSQNAAHGLRRSHADATRAIELILLDAQWVTWTDRVIAEHVFISPKTIGKHRARLEAEGRIERHGARTGKDGRVYDYSKKAPEGQETDEPRLSPEAASEGEPFDTLTMFGPDSRVATPPATTEPEDGRTGEADALARSAQSAPVAAETAASLTATTGTTGESQTVTAGSEGAEGDASGRDLAGAHVGSAGLKPSDVAVATPLGADPRRLIDDIAGQHGLDVWVAVGDLTEDRNSLASRLSDLVAALAADEYDDARAWLDQHFDRLAEVVGGYAPSEPEVP